MSHFHTFLINWVRGPTSSLSSHAPFVDITRDDRAMSQNVIWIRAMSRNVLWIRAMSQNVIMDLLWCFAGMAQLVDCDGARCLEDLTHSLPLLTFSYCHISHTMHI